MSDEKTENGEVKDSDLEPVAGGCYVILPVDPEAPTELPWTVPLPMPLPMPFPRGPRPEVM